MEGEIAFSLIKNASPSTFSLLIVPFLNYKLTCIPYVPETERSFQHFSNFNRHINHLGILLKCRLWFSKSSDAAGLWTTFWVARTWRTFHPVNKLHSEPNYYQKFAQPFDTHTVLWLLLWFTFMIFLQLHETVHLLEISTHCPLFHLPPSISPEFKQ